MFHASTMLVLLLLNGCTFNFYFGGKDKQAESGKSDDDTASDTAGGDGGDDGSPFGIHIGRVAPVQATDGRS